jgi:hypothetical protein
MGPGEAEVVENRCPSMGLMPKCSIFDRLSYETCFEKNYGGPEYISHFFVFPKVFYLSKPSKSLNFMTLFEDS